MRAIAFGDSTTVDRRKSSRILRALLMALAFALNLLLLLGAGLYFMNDDNYRHVLIWSADYFLDSELEIEGEFSVKFGREVELRAETVRLKAKDGSYDLSLGKLGVEQRFASYLSTGTFWINSLSMEDLQAEIIETATGEDFDWREFSLPFLVIEKIQLRNLSVAYTEIDQQRHTISLSHVSLDDTDNQGPVKVSAAGVMNARTLQLDGTLGSLEQLRSKNRDYPFNLTLSRGAVDGDTASQQGRPVIKLDGIASSTPSGSSLVEATFDVAVPELVSFFDTKINADKLGHLQGSLSLAEVGGRWSIRKTQFAATDTSSYQLRIDGKVGNSGQYDLNSEFGVTDPAAFGARFGIDLTGYAPLTGKGLISGDSNRLNYQGKLSVGRIESEATLTASLMQDKPNVRGKLNVTGLYLADIGIDQRLSVPADVAIATKPDTTKQPATEAPASVSDTSVTTSPAADGQPEIKAQVPAADESPLIFDREPIDFSGLQHFNLDLEILIDQIIGADFSIDKLAGQVKLSDGALRITPMRMTFEGGHADLELALDTGNTPSVSLKVTADNLVLGGVVPHEQQDMQVTGNARLHIDINSKGQSIDDLVSSLSGNLSLGLANTRLPRRYVEYLSGDEPHAPLSTDTYTMLEIDGTIAAKLGSDLDITAESIHLRANDGSYDLTLGKLDLQQNIALLLEKGDLWIDKLNLADLHVEIVVAEAESDDGQSKYDQAEYDQADRESTVNEPPDHDWHEFDWQVSDLPFILVENMRLNNISVVYTEGDEQDTYSLNRLVLDNDPSEEPLTLSADGMFNALVLKIEGTVGTPAQPRGKNQVYPMDISLSSGAVGATPDTPVIRLNGTMDRTQPGGSRIEAEFDVSVAELRSIFKQERTEGKLGHLQGSVDFAEVDGRWGLKKLHLTSNDTDLYQLRLDGTVDPSDKFEVRSQFEIPDTPAFGASFGIDLTGYSPYKGEATLTGNRTRLDYKGNWKIGRTENNTTLVISLLGGKPSVQGKFVIPELYLPDIGLTRRLGVEIDDTEKADVDSADTEKADADPGKQPNPESSGPKVEATEQANAKTSEDTQPEVTAPVDADSLIVFAREPLDFSGLHDFNLDLDILIDEIVGVDYSIKQLAGQIKLTDGLLRVAPMRMTFEGGTTDLDFVLDARHTPSVTLKVIADDLVLGKAIADVQEVVPVEGKAHLNIDVKSQGHSPHELASDLSGELSFSLENARIPKKYIELLSVDVFGFVARMVTFEDSYTTLNCVMTSFDIDQGVAKSELFFADGPQLAIKGDATLDLGQETIDMTLLPEQKKRVASGTSTIRVTGPLADPDVETSASKAGAATAVGAAVLVPQIVIPVFLIEQLWKRVFSSDDDTGCADFIAENEAEQQEAEQQETKPKKAKQQLTEQQKARQQNAKQQKAEQLKAEQQKAQQQKAK